MIKPREQIVYGVHPVSEALQAGQVKIERIFAAREARNPRINRILKSARVAGVPVSYLPREVLARKLGRRAVHQGIAAALASYRYADAAELVRFSTEKGAGLVVALDRVEDPGNLGAVVRTAAAAGVDGILLAADASAGMNSAAQKTSAGTSARILIARDPDLAGRLEKMRKTGYEVICLDQRSRIRWDQVDLTGKAVIVAGGESRGARRKVIDKCNIKVAIPLKAGVDSLNVSVAVGIMLYEAVRQRSARKGS